MTPITVTTTNVARAGATDFGYPADGTVTGVTVAGGAVGYTTPTPGTVRLNAAATAGQAVAITYTRTPLVDPSSWIIDTEAPWTPYTPTVSSFTGSLTTASATGRYRQAGKMVQVRIVITITTNGTGASFLQATLPFTAHGTGDQILSGREGQLTGKMLFGNIQTAAPTLVRVRFYDNTYPGADGAICVVEGVYEAA